MRFPPGPWKQSGSDAIVHAGDHAIAILGPDPGVGAIRRAVAEVPRLVELVRRLGTVRCTGDRLLSHPWEGTCASCQARRVVRAVEGVS